MITCIHTSETVQDKLIKCQHVYGACGIVITPKYYELKSSLCLATSDEVFNAERVNDVVNMIFSHIKKSDDVMTFADLKSGLEKRNVRELSDNDYLGDLFAAIMVLDFRIKLPASQQDVQHSYTTFLENGGVFVAFK
ncbi:MAG: hypothetical protein P0S94_02345 [Simkaniaceae bacterium]|nr:hypothetical protein [Simkaniaceae bacterium]